MAKNDTILLDGILSQRILDKFPSTDKGEVFEFFALEQILKDFDLSKEQLDFGWIDGGLDAFYIFANGHLIDDIDNFSLPKSNAFIEVYLITCKHHDTFVQQPLDLLVATFSEIFDFTIDRSDLEGKYSIDLLDMRAILYELYKKLSINKPQIEFNTIYASRGDSQQIGTSVRSRSEQVKNIFTKLFSNCKGNFNFYGAQELIEKYRKEKLFTLNLPFLEHLTSGESHVLLVKLSEYYKFVSDENTNLRRYLFDSNVRDYLGETAVNKDIKKSLMAIPSPDFWWLNNGVTILATKAAILSKSIQLQDIQIVNGLQTTETIYEYFKNETANPEDARALMVKIIVSENAETRDSIIRATNNQSLVESSALHATDKIQRDIEAILAKYDWYYERRKNYYLNIGKPQHRFVTPLYIASAVLSLIMKDPMQASRVKSKHMRSPEVYNKIFSEKYPIEVWPKLVTIYKEIDNTLILLHDSHFNNNEKSRGARRSIIALLVVAKILNKFSFSSDELAKINLSQITSEIIIKTIDEVKSNLVVCGRRITKNNALECCSEIATLYDIKDIKSLKQIQQKNGSISYSLDENFLKKVEELLPSKPFPKDVHIAIAEKLSCSRSQTYKAIHVLTKKNEYLDQSVTP